MKCLTCVSSGQRSTIRCLGSTTTLLGYWPYYDEDGLYHNHDPNHYTTHYRCDNGHAWSENKLKECGAKGCDYGKETVTITNHDQEINL
jgi:hypothetical protein